MQKLDVKAFALATGIPWSIGVLFMGLAAKNGWGKRFVEVVGSMYPGYNASPKGACIGSAWAFLDGAGLGAAMAVIYNAVAQEEVKSD